MTTSNTALRVTELDFAEIKNNLKDYLRSQSQFQDFDFEGSGMSVLLDILAYNTHYMGYYLNMVGNEMFMDTAQLRSSILSHAKNINYVPASSHGALIKANVVVTPSLTEDQVSVVATLEKYTKFLAQALDGVNYPFVALYSNTATKSGDSFTYSNVMIKQGEVVTRQYLMDAGNESRRFEIPSANVDLSTLTITVQTSAVDTEREVYTLAEDITEITGNSAVYFVEENSKFNYTFYFGDDVLGKKPPVDSVIIATYIDNVGSVANNISKLYVSDPIAGEYRDNVIITAVQSAYSGTDKETIEQVRFRAPYFYTAQNRAVTIQDYQTLITKDYNNIDSVAVWGGEDNIPVVYGKVYLSLKTKGNYYLTNEEKEEIKADLITRRNVMTVTPEIIDPDYSYILSKLDVYYDPNLTTLSSNEIATLVRAAIVDYKNRELDKFSATFRSSVLQQYIENAEKSITGSNLTTYIQKRVKLSLGASKNYIVDFGSEIKKGDFNNKLYTTPELQTFDNNGTSRNVYFEEVASSATGIDSITVVDGGINYSRKPTITIVGDGTGAIAEAVVGGGKLTAIKMLSKGSNYTRASVIITNNDNQGYGAVATALLQIRVGTLRTYYLKTTGEKVIIDQDAGSINYETGYVEIYSIYTSSGTPSNRYYDTDTVTVNAPMEREIIAPLRNRILSIDENDAIAININVLAE